MSHFAKDCGLRDSCIIPTINYVMRTRQKLFNNDALTTFCEKITLTVVLKFMLHSETVIIVLNVFRLSWKLSLMQQFSGLLYYVGT
jgi:hypothetical protein